MNRLLITFFLLASCGQDITDNRAKNIHVDPIGVDREVISNSVEPTFQKYNLDSVLALNNLVDIKSVDTTLLVNLKYATPDNFMGVVLYDTIRKAYLQKEVAERLGKSQKYLNSIQPGYRLLIYDAIRPVSVQVKMWNALDTIPAKERGKFVSNPKKRSVHNFGCAVDLTIVNDQGEVLDMGAGYDDFRPIAFPSKEKEFLESGELTQEQLKNRVLLRRVMRFSRFYNIPSEWWHFNAFSRSSASKNFPFLINETGGMRASTNY